MCQEEERRDTFLAFWSPATRGNLLDVKAQFRHAYRFVRNTLGVDPWLGLKRARSFPRFLKTFAAYRAAHTSGPFSLTLTDLHPVLEDFAADAGYASGHYFFQDLWAARKVFERRPKHHIDIGSRVDGFVAHLLTFMPITVLDIRPLDSKVPGLQFVQADATNLVGFADGSVDSISSLHAVEHFGLGRYGDKVDPNGWRKAMNSLQRVLRPGGRLYFGIPIGQERLCFNAHRIFAPIRVLETFVDLKLVSFAGVDDSGRFLCDIRPEQLATSEYACGLFEFTK